MRPLTMKQEKFVNGLIKGLSQREAYKQAGYATKNMKDKTMDERACVLFKNDKVKTRFKELNSKVVKKAEEKSIMSAIEVLEELSVIARSKITDYLKVDDFEAIVGYENNEFGELDLEKPIKKTVRGVEIFKTDEIESKTIGAIAGIKQGKNGIELKLHDKVKALEALAKRYGLNELNVNVESNQTVIDVSKLSEKDLKDILNKG